MKRKAQFVGGQAFWDSFTAFRVANLRGRYGGGKTSLAFIIAARLLAEKRVQRVISNIPCRFAVNEPRNQAVDLVYNDEQQQNNISDIRGIPVPLQDAAIVLDESWMYIESRQDVLDYAAFVRKFEHFLILPSVMPVHTRLSFFTVQRVFNGYTVGLPIWFYKWGIRDKDVKENGYFGILRPTAVFNYYPTKFVAGDDGGISDAVAITSKMAGFKGTRRVQRAAKQQQRAVSVSFEDTLHEVSEGLEDAYETIATDVSSLLDDFKNQTKKASLTLRK